MEYLRADPVEGFLCINRIESLKKESVAIDGPLFMVRLKIIFEHGYRFFCRHGTPTYFLPVRSPGRR
jgi:hypothetical protein